MVKNTHEKLKFVAFEWWCTCIFIIYINVTLVKIITIKVFYWQKFVGQYISSGKMYCPRPSLEVF